MWKCQKDNRYSHIHKCRKINRKSRDSFWQPFVFTLCCTGLNLCHLENVKSFFLSLSPPISQPVTTETRFGPVLYNRHYSSVASLRPVSSPPPSPPISLLPPSISSSLLFLSVSLFQLSFLRSLIPSVTPFYPHWFVVDSAVCGRSISMGPHSHRQRNEDTHTHRHTQLLLTHPCVLILAFWVSSEKPQRLSEGASFSCCLASCSFRIGTTVVWVILGLRLSDKMVQLFGIKLYLHSSWLTSWLSVWTAAMFTLVSFGVTIRLQPPHWWRVNLFSPTDPFDPSVLLLRYRSAQNTQCFC